MNDHIQRAMDWYQIQTGRPATHLLLSRDYWDELMSKFREKYGVCLYTVNGAIAYMQPSLPPMTVLAGELLTPPPRREPT